MRPHSFETNRSRRRAPELAAHWESRCKALLDRAVRRFNLGKLSFPYERGFPAEYRSLLPPRVAVRDALQMETMVRSGRETVDLRRPAAGRDEAHCRVQVYGERERSLDEIMPFLRNLNLHIIDQIQFKIAIGGHRFFIRSFSVEPVAAGVRNLLALREPLLQVLDALLSGEVEDDALNGLILLTGLHWKEIDLFRAYRNYYFQLSRRFGRFRFHQALLGNPAIAHLLLRYFEARFAPDGRWRDQMQREEEALSPIRLELIAALEAVGDVNDDRILRDLFNLIDATLRTNFYRRRDQSEYFIALKISGLGVINMPSPKPFVEIYVHSKHMEGLHLRSAKVARGGIRWSDRPDDFRSEILDLMQTQIIKNTLIVPHGAKGGFILKTAYGNAAERSRKAQEAYTTLMRGLLDLTDNLEGAQVVRPSQVITYDDADPYLVVAADKGTAGWSDLANGIAATYGYWLGDAFASGGSQGYHHKRLGITARGAWVCVKRHFHELGRNIDRQSFTAVGVGSMDGDVFGNGMLQSKRIHLLGAFSAEHIFLDPNPDAEAAFMERKRLFELPGSSWQDYDQACISPGGGVYRRNATNIPLSSEIRKWLGLRHRSIDGEGLIRVLLTAPVDLLWLGGIGTYIKAGSESNEEVGDRANDCVRVDAVQLRAKVVGEGANLGFTQRARIEYALNGGCINTDAVDNSAGVDLSDHEVNLKILAALLQQRGAVAPEERNRLLVELTDAVCRSVLANNDRQSLCLSLERERSLKDVEPLLEAADRLEHMGLLDRTSEAFPLRKEIQIRAGRELVRPELAVLMAYAKLALKRALRETPDFLRAAWTGEILAAYFPETVRSRYGAHLGEHPLGQEITATVICNTVIDQAGAGFLAWTDEPDRGLFIDAVGAYLTFDRILESGRLREKLCALDGKPAASRQYGLLLQLEDALAYLSCWALRHDRRLVPESALVDTWRTDLRAYLDHRMENLDKTECPRCEERLAELAAMGFTITEAQRLAFLSQLRDFPMLVELSRHSGEALRSVAKLADTVTAFLEGPDIAALLAGVTARDRWECRLEATIENRLRSGLARLCRMMLRGDLRDPAAFFRQCGMQHRLAKFLRLRRELEETAPTSLTPFAALIGELEALIDDCGAAGEGS